jgi:hypothetical protein
MNPVSLALAGLIPFGVVLALVGIWRAACGRSAPGWLWAMLLVAGFATAFRWIDGRWPGWPLNTASEWTVLAAALCGLFMAAIGGRLPPWAFALLCGLLSAGAMVASLQSQVRGSWDTGKLIGQLELAGSMGAVTAWALALLDLRQKSLTTFGLLAILGLFAGLVQLMSGSVSLGQWSFALAGGSVALGIAGIFLTGSHRAAVGVFVPILVVLLFRGVHLSELRLAHAVLLASAPVVALLVEHFLARRRGSAAAVSIRVIGFLLPMLAAVGWALPEFLKTIDSSAGSGSYGY